MGAEVGRTLAEPERVVPDPLGREVWMRRYWDARVGQEMLVRAVVEEERDERVVVTVYATSWIGKYFGREKIVKVVYDKETDSLVITLREGPIRESDEVRPGVIADVGDDGGVARFEILRASRVVENAGEVQFATVG